MKSLESLRNEVTISSKSRIRKIWSYSEKVKFVHYNKKMTESELARKVGRSIFAIKHKRKQVAEYVRIGLTNKEIVEKM